MVMNRNPTKNTFFALSLPKCSDKISVHKNVEANKNVPKATGSENKKNLQFLKLEYYQL